MMNASGGQEVQWEIAILLGFAEPDQTGGKDLGRFSRVHCIRQ
jgi:hypothetical protein